MYTTMCGFPLGIICQRLNGTKKIIMASAQWRNVNIYAYIYMSTYVYIHIYIRIHTYICMPIYIYTYTCIYIYICIYMCGFPWGIIC